MSEKIKITFLGTSAQIPSAKRNHTAILLNYSDENILIDCGEGTQRQFRIAKLNPCRLTRILITHWHGDHVLGIPGLLQTIVSSGYNKTLFIYGPKGTENFTQNLLNIFIPRGKLKIKIREIFSVSEGAFLETEKFSLASRKMTHDAPCNSYCFVKKGQIKINKEKLKKSGIPSTILLQELKKGKNIMYKGKKYFSKDLTFKEKGKKVSFVLDTSFNKTIAPFVRNSDLLICESTFDSNLMEKAHKYKHLTVVESAKIAKESKSEKLILTHISQRYDNDNKKILEEAKRIFKNSFLANDFDKFEI